MSANFVLIYEIQRHAFFTVVGDPRTDETKLGIANTDAFLSFPAVVH